MNRADLSERLSMSGTAPTKTYVVEAHADDPAPVLARLEGVSSVRPTDDVYLFEVATGFGDLWVDTLDRRFWRFHTDASVAESNRFLRRNIEARRDLDWIWLSSGQLRSVWPQARRKAVLTDFRSGRLTSGVSPASTLRLQLKGDAADAITDLISSDPRYRSALAFDRIQIHADEPEYGTVEEVISRRGKFLVSGDSFELHSAIVSSVVDRYRAFVEACEGRGMRWSGLGDEGGGRLSGSVISLNFGRPIEDLRGWIDELVSSRAPFRLWGVPRFEDGIAEVDAVDLHIGHRLRLAVGEDWLRVYLPSGSCGNTVARLIANLQHRFDGSLTLVDNELEHLRIA
ncbi:hypothetical protein [Pseudofrankia asymbiotica]|uniref:Uncharacterized protein n=1 Tax=Pseudofrankia asymbiotica TaxID=1834516 RepID=A0A1V2IDM1_9ACTN|nr:hypothetical protein [Pseudofrankia asymbiotica]ONH31254.1 hypothetical protein BL253_10350 [Pseudofrankia asymbiotica]